MDSHRGHLLMSLLPPHVHLRSHGSLFDHGLMVKALWNYKEVKYYWSQVLFTIGLLAGKSLVWSHYQCYAGQDMWCHLLELCPLTCDRLLRYKISRWKVPWRLKCDWEDLTFSSKQVWPRGEFFSSWECKGCIIRSLELECRYNGNEGVLINLLSLMVCPCSCIHLQNYGQCFDCEGECWVIISVFTGILGGGSRKF